ncbi:hypothetical protein L0F51_03805 [Afifella sp. H1R]|nr:hypothetical protein [Afifella sp. H1R]
MSIMHIMRLSLITAALAASIVLFGGVMLARQAPAAEAPNPEGMPAVRPNCNEAGAMMLDLAMRYGETPLVRGTIGPRRMVTLVNPDTGTWTVIVIRPDGLACQVASGEDWDVIRGERRA